MDCCQAFALDQPGEKLLCEILSVLLVVTAPAHECIQGKPVTLAERAQRLASVRRSGIACREHHTPMSRPEITRGRRSMVATRMSVGHDANVASPRPERTTEFALDPESLSEISW